MSDWIPYNGMLGSTPYSDWRVKANVEKYIRGANFDPDKFARALRYVETGRGFMDEFFGLLGRSETSAVSAHFSPDREGGASRVAYAAPSNDVDDTFRSTEDVVFEFGPLVDRAILRTPQAEPDIKPSFDTQHWKDEDAVCAIIDDTIGFANARFRKSATKTRIEALWIMDGKNAPSIPKEIEVFGGLVLFREQIDELLSRFYSDGSVDEAALYAHMDSTYDVGLGVLASATHGTHVLDLFAGAGMGTPSGEDGERPIIAVVLPQLAVRDSSGTHSEFFVQEAMAWINSLSQKFRTGDEDPIKLVTNFSFGLLAGPHDGHSLLEQSLSTLTTRVNSAAVVPAGNSYESRTHALATVSPRNAEFSIDMELSPLNRLSTFIEIWRPVSDPVGDPALTLSIDTPWGSVSEVNPKLGQGFEWLPNGNLTMRTYHLSVPRSRGGKLVREVAMIAILPTDAGGEDLPIAPAGRWRLTLTYSGANEEEIDLWIQRGGSVYGHPALGRQTRFAKDQPGIDHLGTLNALATAHKVVSVGGFVGSGKFPAAHYTSAGSPRFYCDLPDVSVESEQSGSVPGITATGTFTGSYANLSGTSVAAPQVARFLANMDFGVDAKAFVHVEASKQSVTDRFRLGAGRLFLPRS